MITEFRIGPGNSKEINDTLHVGTKGTLRTVRANLRVFKYQDKDTRQFVAYLPSIEISAYGETREKAEQMLRFSLEQYFSELAGLPTKDFEKELRGLGWRQNRIRNKDYSKTFVDVTGELKNFAVDEAVEQEAVTTF